MTNEQLLQQKVQQWEAWYAAQQMPQQQTPQYKTAQQQVQPPNGKKQKKKAAQQSRKSPMSQAEWYIILIVAGAIALRIVWTAFTTEPPQAERQRIAKVTAR
jgi:ferric-dicitrate binding protein FerR (iron transport regulator)